MYLGGAERPTGWYPTIVDAGWGCHVYRQSVVRSRRVRINQASEDVCTRTCALCPEKTRRQKWGCKTRCVMSVSVLRHTSKFLAVARRSPALIAHSGVRRWRLLARASAGRAWDESAQTQFPQGVPGVLDCEDREKRGSGSNPDLPAAPTRLVRDPSLGARNSQRSRRRRFDRREARC